MDRGADQHVIYVSAYSAVRVTYGAPPSLEHFPGPLAGGGSGRSEHWICTGDGSPDWQASIRAYLRALGAGDSGESDDRVVFRLAGRNFPVPDYHVIPIPSSMGCGADYAMSDLVQPATSRRTQLMLVEYSKALALLGGSGNDVDDLDACLQPRHLGRANFARIDGSVGSITKEQLLWEFSRYQGNATGLFAP